MKIHKKAYKYVHNTMINHCDCSFSGTTCCTVLLEGRRLISANVGDSRAIIVNSQGKIKELTRDHKPDINEEKARILANGGRVTTLRKDKTGQPTGPKRVYLKNEDIPGLAMSRSLGDYVAHSVGVSAEPEILEF
jgi:serine/threonine protein phosphatase PrpC